MTYYALTRGRALAGLTIAPLAPPLVLAAITILTGGASRIFAVSVNNASLYFHFFAAFKYVLPMSYFLAFAFGIPLVLGLHSLGALSAPRILVIGVIVAAILSVVLVVFFLKGRIQFFKPTQLLYTLWMYGLPAWSFFATYALWITAMSRKQVKT